MGSNHDDEDEASADGIDGQHTGNVEGTDESDNPVAKEESPEETTSQTQPSKRRRIKVCAMCTHSPALSKYDSLPPEATELVQQIQELEDVLESGLDANDGHKLTLREVRGVERQIEKLRVEIKEFGKKKNGNEDGEEEDSEDEGSGGEESKSGESDHVEEEDEDDPFLKAVGGKDKLLVGEDYQKMLLAREQQYKDS